MVTPTLPTRRGGMRAVIAVAGMGLVLLLSACSFTFNTGQPAEQSQEQIEVQKKIDSFVDDITSANTFPLRVDSVTEVDDVVAEKNAVHYFYTVTGQSQSKADEDALKDQILESVCTAENTKELMSLGVHMIHTYGYADSGGTFVVDVAKAGCS